MWSLICEVYGPSSEGKTNNEQFICKNSNSKNDENKKAKNKN